MEGGWLKLNNLFKNLFLFQEKQKRDAEEKVKQIRKTLQEQEHLQERLRMQKEQSDADNEWLQSEDVRSYAPPGSTLADAKERLSKRHSWKEGVRSVVKCFFV